MFAIGTSIADLPTAINVPTAAFVAEWDKVEKLKSANAQDNFGRKFLKHKAADHRTTQLK